MSDDRQAMDRPAAPPEARLIRLVREAAGIKLPEAAAAAGISKARWSQVETGYETRPGGVRAVRGRASTVAHMAHAVGIPPDRLEGEGERPDAAEVLREILRQGTSPAAARANAGDPLAELSQVLGNIEDLTEPERAAFVALAALIAARRSEEERRGALSALPG